MEGAPYQPEYSPENEIEKKKRPSAETIGSLFLEKNPEFELRKNVSKEKLGQALVDFEMQNPKRETNFELDPILRHMDELETGGTTSTSSLSGLLQKADQSITTDKSTAINDNSDDEQSTVDATKQQIKLADVVMYSVIFILAALVIMLILSRN